MTLMARNFPLEETVGRMRADINFPRPIFLAIRTSTNKVYNYTCNVQ